MRLVPDPAPTLIFDGDCGFCRAWVERWQGQTGGAFQVSSLQEWPSPEPPREALTRAVHLVESGGRVSRGAEAVFRALATSAGTAAPWWAYRHVPGFAPASETVYRWVSTHRGAAARLARLAWGDAVPPGQAVTRAVFMRGLALIYAAAFLSAWVQVSGLIGSRGIWPAADYLGYVQRALGARAWLEMPSVFLAFPSDASLHAACGAGVLLAVALAVGVWPRAVLFLLWALYLSLEHAGYVFFGYQWDALLLEVGLVAIPFAPAGFWRGKARPHWSATWLLRWLLFRLMFMSGMVKLLSGDPTWRDLTALRYHYWTQPLSTWTAALANDMPGWFLTASCAVMFAIELGAPFLIFGIRWMRLGACALLVFLQLAILSTGDYGFFNWLTLVLCIPLLDDRLLRRRPAAAEPPPIRGRPERWARRTGLALFAGVYLVASGSALWVGLGRRHGAVPRAASALLEALSPLGSVNAYGLFAVMTTERPEIILEGSDDGESWKPYELRWKPGRLDRRPGFVAPHQPRLDWQLWFAALRGSCNGESWFLAFERRLLEGSPEVLALIAENPFPDRPPRRIRALLYQYRFASREDRARGIWWTREAAGTYCPALTLEGGRLVAAP